MKPIIPITLFLSMLALMTACATEEDEEDATLVTSSCVVNLEGELKFCLEAKDIKSPGYPCIHAAPNINTPIQSAEQ